MELCLTITKPVFLWPTKFKILPSKGILEIHTVEAPFPKGVAGMMGGKGKHVRNLEGKCGKVRWFQILSLKFFVGRHTDSLSCQDVRVLLWEGLKQTQEQWRSSQHRWVAWTNCPLYYYYFYYYLPVWKILEDQSSVQPNMKALDKAVLITSWKLGMKQRNLQICGLIIAPFEATIGDFLNNVPSEFTLTIKDPAPEGQCRVHANTNFP